MRSALISAAVALLLSGCEIPGLGPDPRIAQREADGKAIGAACRHALRGIEDCYSLNEKTQKTSIFEGWKEMDQYMRENKLEGILPKEAKAQEVEEIIVDEKKAKTLARDKSSAELKPKADLTLASSKAPEKSSLKTSAR